MAARATTLVSIVGGVALGAVAAIYGSRPVAQRAAPPRAASAVGRIEPSLPEQDPVSAEPAPTSEESRESRPARAWGEIPTDFDAVSTSEAEAFCGVRNLPSACLAAARAYESTDPAKARTFRLLALSHFAELCTERDPEACEKLASLYDQGVAVPENTESPSALRTRARELCAEHKTEFCSRLGSER